MSSHSDFTPLLPPSAATDSWISMLLLWREQLFQPDSLLNQPLVGLPFVDGLVRGILFAADHRYREALTGADQPYAPSAVRTAVDVIEAEAHLPLTLSSIAARSHICVRTLQQGFQRHLGTSPMAYLREVRLRRAHQTLLESDPSTVTVTSVAHDWVSPTWAGSPRLTPPAITKHPRKRYAGKRPTIVGRKYRDRSRRDSDCSSVGVGFATP